MELEQFRLQMETDFQSFKENWKNLKEHDESGDDIYEEDLTPEEWYSEMIYFLKKS